MIVMTEKHFSFNPIHLFRLKNVQDSITFSQNTETAIHQQISHSSRVFDYGLDIKGYSMPSKEQQTQNGETEIEIDEF